MIKNEKKVTRVVHMRLQLRLPASSLSCIGLLNTNVGSLRFQACGDIQYSAQSFV